MRQGCGGGAARHWRPSAMGANRGMVAGSRDGVVTIRHDGDGPTVRSSRLRALRPLPPPRRSVSFRMARGHPSICGVAVLRRADCVGSASDWLAARSLLGMPRFLSGSGGGFRCGVRVDSLQCSPRHQRAVASLRNAQGIELKWTVRWC